MSNTRIVTCALAAAGVLLRKPLVRHLRALGQAPEHGATSTARALPAARKRYAHVIAAARISD